MQLHKNIKNENISLAALNGMRDEILGRQETRRKDEVDIIERIGEALETETETGSDEFENSLRTQNEMNRYAFHLADLAERELEFLISALEDRLNERELVCFRKAQKGWRAYAESQAEFSSFAEEGGSMQPLIRSTEFRALVIERAAKIKEEIRQRNDDW